MNNVEERVLLTGSEAWHASLHFFGGERKVNIVNLIFEFWNSRMTRSHQRVGTFLIVRLLII